MRDLVGNKLEKGSLVYWLNGKVVGRVTEVEEPAIQTGEERPAYLTVQIRFPIFRDRGMKEHQIDSMLSILDPNAQGAIERLMGGPQAIPPRKQ